MNRSTFAALFFGFAITPCHLFAEGGSPGDSNWPQWRGPASDGVAPGELVTEWSEEKNVLWKVATPGSGTGTPIVWGGKIYLAAAINTGRNAEAGAETGAAATGGFEPGAQFVQAPAPEDPDRRPPRRRFNFDGPLPDWMKEYDKDSDGKLNEEEQEAMRAAVRERFSGGGGRRRGGGGGGGGFGGGGQPTEVHQFVLLCYDLGSGEELWRKVAKEEVPHEGHHRDHGFASASPVTDGERLIVSFGSRGIFAFDMEGNKLWERDLGDMRTRAGFGEGASPALHGDVVVVPWDHEGDSFIVALNADTGDELWRKERDNATAWYTPLVVEFEGATQVVTASETQVCAYDLKSGDVIWRTEGLTGNVIPSPVTDGELVFAMSGFRGAKLRAIRLGAKGDLSEGEGVVWTADEGTPYVPSPLLYEGRLYFFQGNTNLLTCLDAKTGDVHYSRERVEGINGVYASPVGANGHVYLVGRDGNCVVIKSGDQLEVVATNELDENFDASAAVAGDRLLLRGHGHLYCIGAE